MNTGKGQWLPGAGGERDEELKNSGLSGSKTTLTDTKMVDLSDYTFVNPRECTIPGVNLKINNGLWDVSKADASTITNVLSGGATTYMEG